MSAGLRAGTCTVLLLLGVTGVSWWAGLEGAPRRSLLAAAQDPVAGVHRQYFAEGASGFFETVFGLVNPSETDTAEVSLRLLTDVGEQFTHNVTLGPRQRATIAADDVLGGLTRSFSAIVESDVPVAADRFMRWGGLAAGSSLESAVAEPSQTWFFAEGAKDPFATFYLLFNPGTTPANVSVDFFQALGAAVQQSYVVPPETRLTVWVDGEIPTALVGAAFTADVPIVAERAMYLTVGGEVFRAGAAAAGAPAPSDIWYFAEGIVGPFLDEFLLLINPAATAAVAEVTLYAAGAGPVTQSYPLAPMSRRTIWVNAEAASDPVLAPLAGQPISLVVRADQPIVAERAMWAPHGGGPWYENHTTRGATAPATLWSVPSGATGGAANAQTFVLVFNPTDQTAEVRTTLLLEDDTTQMADGSIAPFGRLTMDVGAMFGLVEATFSVLVESLGDEPATDVPLVVEYVRYGGGLRRHRVRQFLLVVRRQRREL